MRTKELSEQDAGLGRGPRTDILFLLPFLILLTSRFQISRARRVQLPALTGIRSGSRGGIVIPARPTAGGPP